MGWFTKNEPEDLSKKTRNELKEDRKKLQKDVDDLNKYHSSGTAELNSLSNPATAPYNIVKKLYDKNISIPRKEEKIEEIDKELSKPFWKRRR